MSSIRRLVTEQTKQTEEFKARKNAEREELNEMCAAAVRAVTSDPEAYLRYLDVQADNPGFSTSNVLLVLRQNADVTVFNSAKGWNEQGRVIKNGEKGVKVRVSETYIKNGREYTGFKVGHVFDVSQTTGKPLPGKIVLADDTAPMETALAALLYQSPVSVEPITDVSDLDAFYDPQQQVIRVSEELTDSQTFAALAREIFHAKVHNRGNNYYGRTETELDAGSAAYMLCRGFGIACEKPDMSRLKELYEGEEPQDARNFLDEMQRIFRQMQVAVLREIEPEQQKRTRHQPEKYGRPRGGRR